MKKVCLLQHILLERFSLEKHNLEQRRNQLEQLPPTVSEDTELAEINRKLANISNQMQEIAQARTFVMDFLLMELDGEVSFRHPAFDAQGAPVFEHNPKVGEQVRVNSSEQHTTGSNLVFS